MQVLALDTTTEACSAAVLTATGLVIGAFEEVGRGHAEQILGMVHGVLGQAGLKLGQLDGIAVGVGPGAFTGIRIGVSMAQGLAFGAGLPVVAVTSLEALALPVLRGGVLQVMACLDARMGEIYWGCFQADARRGLLACGAPTVGSAADARLPFAGSFHAVGRGFTAYPVLKELPGVIVAPGAGDALPDARDLAVLGALRLAAGEGIDPAALTPLYLRDQVALTEAQRAAAKQGVS